MDDVAPVPVLSSPMMVGRASSSVDCAVLAKNDVVLGFSTSFVGKLVMGIVRLVTDAPGMVPGGVGWPVLVSVFCVVVVPAGAGAEGTGSVRAPLGGVKV
jgi:ascorbate-specific PTS system EIIC-type component UlaA